MSRLLLTVAALISASALVSAQEGGKDRYGDPLPRGAVARLGTTRLRHTGSWRLVDAAFSPDGKVLASLGGDDRLRLWDTADGKELQNFLLKDLPLLSLYGPTLAFSNDGKTVAVSSGSKIALCLVGDAKHRFLPEQADSVNGVTFAPDDKLLAVYGSAATVSLIDPATGKGLRKLTGHEKAVYGAVFSADGKTLATTSEDFTCRIWNVEDGNPVRVLETTKQRAPLVALSADGKWLAWWDEEPRIHVRDLATGKEHAAFKAGRALFILDWRQCALGFAPDNTLRALDRSLHLFEWHPQRGLTSRDFQPVSGKTAYGRIARDGKNAVLWDWDHGTALHLFDLESGKEMIVAEGHLKLVYEVAAQPGGKWIASSSSDGTVRLWDAANAREKYRWQPESAWHPILFTQDGKLAFGAYDGQSHIKIIDLDKETAQRLETKRTRQLALSADGKLLLATDLTRLEIWDFTNGKRLQELDDVPETKLPVLKIDELAPWLSYTVGALTVAPDGKLAAAAFTRSGNECSIYLWDTATGKTLPAWPGIREASLPIAFSPDGKYFAAGNRRGEKEWAIALWDIGKREIVKRFPIGAIAFSRDGKLLAVAGDDKGTVYEVASGKETARIPFPLSPACMAFSNDGSNLITGHADGTLLVWDLRSKALRK